MTAKQFFVAFLVVGGLWYGWNRPPSAVAVSAPPPSAGVSSPQERQAPVQQNLSRGPQFEVNGHSVRALAEYAVTARVLSAKTYRSGRESELSPLDLALGWGRMSDPRVIDRISISQSGRWYSWRYEGEPPIPRREIEVSSANVHLIPASATVARTLDRAETGKVVALRGYLVEVTSKDGWSWRSSLTREDTGGGACEVMFVQSAEVR